MMEKARRGTKRVVVEMELVKEEYNERNETGAFSELKTSLALPRQGMPMYVEVRWGGGMWSIDSPRVRPSAPGQRCNTVLRGFILARARPVLLWTSLWR